MSMLQKQALNEMWRQGLHIQASAAERCWDMGGEYSLDVSISVPRSLRDLLAQCNREVTG